MDAPQPDRLEADLADQLIDNMVPAPTGDSAPPGRLRAGSWGELHLRLLEQLAPPSMLVDGAYDIVHLSPGAGRFLQPAGGEPSRNLLRSVHPDLRPALCAALSQAGQSRGPVQIEQVPLQLDGERNAITLRVASVGEAGLELFLVLFQPPSGPQAAPAAPARRAIEVGPPVRERDRELERLQAQLLATTQDLERTRADLHQLMDATAIAIVVLDRELRITRYTPSAAGLFNLIPTDLGRPLTDLASPFDDPQLGADAQRVLGGREAVEREVGRSDGRWYLARLLPRRSGEDEVAGVLLSVVDISAARRAQAALCASEERLRLVAQHAGERAILALDLDRRVSMWNCGAERLLGYAEAEVLGQSADLVFSAQDRAAGVPEQELRMALSEGRAASDRLYCRKDGSLFWASGLCLPVRDHAGRPVGLVKILHDRTSERDARQALQRSQAELVDALAGTQRARQQLEAAEAAKDRFLAVLSHELRNPLASIASASELLLMPRLPPAALEKAAQVVHRQARAMKALLDELLDVSRLTLGRLTLSRRPVAVVAIIQSALEATRPLVQAAGHELVLRLPPPAVEVDGDPLRLAQVVSNLVGNAARYTPEGGRIVVDAEVLQDEVVISVEDNGIGMDPAEIERMFDLFSQGQGAIERANGGLGIGLALARNIVELHGGWIMASSAGPGSGSQLRVGLPLLRAASGGAPAPRAEPPAQPPTAAAAAEGELILVADDNGDAAWGLGKLLELSGFRTVLARSGQEALKVAEQQRPAIALLDIGMPDLSGHAVARRLRATDWGAGMILIAATGWGQDADVRQSLEAGFDAHLTKPLNVGRIRSLVEELAARRRRG